MEPLVEFVWATASPEETRAVGRLVGEAAVPGLLLALTGELGGGKTCFAQGLAAGLDVPPDEPVTSPTYTLINEYTGRLPLFHADLYRLSGPDDLEETGFFECLDAGGVTAVEWAERAGPGVLSPDVEIAFRPAGETGRTLRARAWTPRGAELVRAVDARPGQGGPGPKA